MSKESSTTPSGATSKKGSEQAVAAPSKLDTLVALLRTPSGASIQELAAATSWQPHSVRGALAGALKKKGHSISSDNFEGTRRYRIVEVRA